MSDKAVITNKQKLTFEIGKRLEAMLLDLLDESGVHIIRHPYTYICKEYPSFRGHADFLLLNDCCDAIAIGEIKTANDSSFRIFQKKGVRLWYPEYYDQAQSYMGMSGINITIFIVINKDTSQMHEEIVSFNPIWYHSLVQKAIRIGQMEKEPERLSEKPQFFKCKMCFYKEICHVNN